MTSIVTDFKSIKRKLDRMEQKAEFDEKEAAKADQSPAMYGWPYGAVTPYMVLEGEVYTPVGADGCGSSSASRLGGGAHESVTLSIADLPPPHGCVPMADLYQIQAQLKLGTFKL